MNTEGTRHSKNLSGHVHSQLPAWQVLIEEVFLQNYKFTLFLIDSGVLSTERDLNAMVTNSWEFLF